MLGVLPLPELGQVTLSAPPRSASLRAVALLSRPLSVGGMSETTQVTAAPLGEIIDRGDGRWTSYDATTLPARGVIRERPGEFTPVIVTKYETRSATIQAVAPDGSLIGTPRNVRPRTILPPGFPIGHSEIERGAEEAVARAFGSVWAKERSAASCRRDAPPIVGYERRNAALAVLQGWILDPEHFADPAEEDEPELTLCGDAAWELQDTLVCIHPHVLDELEEEVGPLVDVEAFVFRTSGTLVLTSVAQWLLAKHLAAVDPERALQAMEYACQPRSWQPHGQQLTPEMVELLGAGLPDVEAARSAVWEATQRLAAAERALDLALQVARDTP